MGNEHLGKPGKSSEPGSLALCWFFVAGSCSSLEPLLKSTDACPYKHTKTKTQDHVQDSAELKGITAIRGHSLHPLHIADGGGYRNGPSRGKWGSKGGREGERHRCQDKTSTQSNPD